LFLYYITDRTQFPGTLSARINALLRKICEAAAAGVDFIQLREKDLSTRELEQLARSAVKSVRENSGGRTRLLLNSRSDVALAVGADGVHLRSQDISVSAAAEVWKLAGANPPTIAVSCHGIRDVEQAAKGTTSFVVFAPVFEKGRITNDDGVATLKEACRQKIPVIALGGVTLENAKACLDAGAAGVAGIRLFQENDIATTVQSLRAMRDC